MPATSPLGRLRGVRPPPLTDVVLALGQTTVALLLGSEYHDQWRPLDAEGYVLISLASLPTAFRRQAPLTVLALCGIAWFWSITAGYWPALNPYGCLVALYTIAAQRTRRTALGAGAVVASIWLYAGLLGMRASGLNVVELLSVSAQAVVILGVVVRFGGNARTLAERNGQLARMAEQLRREQADRARRAVVEERVRIARELHDVIAHHTSVISVHAGMAGYVFASDPASARNALGVIADSSREAQEELRRMLSLLRVGAQTLEYAESTHRRPPGLARLDELVERMRAAGVPVEVVTSGRPSPLSPGHDLCAYRVIQESLTNVLKHAQPSGATVTLEYRPGRFTARVADDGGVPETVAGGSAATMAAPSGARIVGSGGPVMAGPGAAATETGDGAPGHGLVGMAERARIYGGTLSAGRRPGGGFEVALTLPTGPHPRP